VADYLLLAIAALAAGAVNAVAGGGSLISFPALLHVGLPSVVANATNTIAIWPGTVSSAWAYRDFIRSQKHRAWVLALPSLLGGLAGSVLLLHTGEQLFSAIVPWLILFACGLLALQGPVSRFVLARAGGGWRSVPWLLWGTQLLVAVYGGYFGAGIGILMLAAMAIFIPDSLQAANGLKVLCSLLINGMAAIYFLIVGAVDLERGLLMAVMSLVGGFIGARFAQRLDATVMRLMVVGYGLIVAGSLVLAG
jgi:uncharacterized protein